MVISALIIAGPCVQAEPKHPPPLVDYYANSSAQESDAESLHREQPWRDERVADVTGHFEGMSDPSSPEAEEFESPYEEALARYDIPASPDTASESNMPEPHQSPEICSADSAGAVLEEDQGRFYKQERFHQGRPGARDSNCEEQASWDRADSPRAAQRL